MLPANANVLERPVIRTRSGQDCTAEQENYAITVILLTMVNGALIFACASLILMLLCQRKIRRNTASSSRRASAGVVAKSCLLVSPAVQNVYTPQLLATVEMGRCPAVLWSTTAAPVTSVPVPYETLIQRAHQATVAQSVPLPSPSGNSTIQPDNVSMDSDLYQIVTCGQTRALSDSVEQRRRRAIFPPRADFPIGQTDTSVSQLTGCESNQPRHIQPTLLAVRPGDYDTMPASSKICLPLQA